MPAPSRHSAFRAAALATCAMTLASACTSLEGGTMQRIFDSWKGVPVEQAKAQWGPPQSVQTVPGGTAFVWTDEIPTAHPPGSGPRDARLEPPQTFARCQRKLVAGPDGTVVGGEWSGTACCIHTLFGQCATLMNRARATG